MPIQIHRIRIGSERSVGPYFAGEIVPANHFGSRKKVRRGSAGRDGERRIIVSHISRPAQVVMRIVDACIEHRHANALPVKPLL